MALKNKKKNGLFPSERDVKNTLCDNLHFSAVEHYKLLRTNLSFTLPEDVKCPIIGVTSSVRGEGKSTTSINLAYVYAESGKRVLLIDGDLRLPSIAKKLRIPSTPGLTNCLVGGENITLEKFRSDIRENWYIIPSGQLPPNPSELLASKKTGRFLTMLSERFDCIIVDLPPVNIVSDAVAISKYLTGMIVVVKENYTEKSEFESCKRQLKLSNVHVLGTVMTDADSGKSHYGRYKNVYKYYTSAEQHSDPAEELDL